MHVLFGPRATAFSGLFAGKSCPDRFVIHGVDAGQWCHRGPCRLQRIGLTVSPPLLFSATHLLVLFVRPNLSNKSALPFESVVKEILRHILPWVCAEAFARGLIERQDRQHVRKSENVFAP